MHWIFRPSIRRKIVGIAVGLIILMVLTSVLSVVMENKPLSHDVVDGGYYVPTRRQVGSA